MQTIIHTILRRPHWLAAVLAGSLFLFSKCGQAPQSSANTEANTTLNTEPHAMVPTASLSIAPPFAGVDVPFQTFVVNGQKGGKIQVATGTQIDIPAQAFVDAQGKPVAGDVRIEYREFHDAADILASGIPMHNPATGEYMETAGMFEIQGKLPSGEVVQIAANKTLAIQCASFNDSDTKGSNPQFDFFELQRPTCGWNKKGTTKPESNEPKTIALRELDKQRSDKPTRPSKKGETDGFVFELDANYTQFPELKAFKGVIWEYAGDPNSPNNPEKDKTIFQKTWDDMRVERGSEAGSFVLRLTEGKTEFQCPVRPVLAGGDYDKALKQYNERMETYERISKEQAQERKRLEQQADLVRSFQVERFGIFNWDIWHRPGRIACKPQPQIAGAETGIETYHYFLITETNRSVVRYTYKELQQFSFDPADENKLVAVLPDNKMAIFGVEDFKKLNPSTIQNTEPVFRMRVLPNPVRSLADIEAALAS